MSWDPANYLAFASERTRPAAELLARVPLLEPASVVDIGCGPGNSTALLVARWPNAEIEGLDSSAEMIAQANAAKLRARFTLADASSWSPVQRYDVVFSNATYQWVPDHRTLLPRLMAIVKAGGVFAFQVPSNFDAPSHVLMREVTAQGSWSRQLAAVREAGVLTAVEYHELLTRHAKTLDIWQTEYLQVLDGEDAVYRWVSATGLRPFVQALEADERESFIAAYKERLKTAYPRRADGTTLFPFRRLFAVALC